jgi:uncharacterized protein (DUF1501 family)
MTITRRNFLKQATLISLAPAVPAFLRSAATAAQPQRDGRVLVVIQLDGGNDGINTVVPFADEGYARHRPTLRLPRQGLIRISDSLGLHPALRDLAGLWEGGRLAVVQGVGVPNPTRSHASEMATWQTARLDPMDHRVGLGWIGQALSAAPQPNAGVGSFYIGLEAIPPALRGRASTASALAQLDDFASPVPATLRSAIAGQAGQDDLTNYIRQTLLDGYTTAAALQEAARAREDRAYPPTELARRLQLVARLLKSGSQARVFYTTQPGYDTHGHQLPQHALLLRNLAGALHAFLEDLSAARLADRVCVLIFSEFGRRVAENGSAGTDHGTAAPVFLAGPSVQTRLVGETPSLTDLVDGDLRTTIDFRRVYATILEDWLDLPARAALGGAFDRLRLF